LVGFAVSRPGVTPVPDAGKVRFAFVAVLAIAKLPVTVPGLSGEN